MAERERHKTRGDAVVTELRQRQPRQEDEKHLAFVRTLSCCCGCNRHGPSEAAHIRGNWNAPEKRECGKAEKPDDKWTTPLNTECHRLQHSMAEESFWLRVGKDPFQIARRLWVLSGGEKRASQAQAPKQERVVKPRKNPGRRKRVTQSKCTIPGKRFNGTPIPARVR